MQFSNAKVLLLDAVKPKSNKFEVLCHALFLGIK